MLVRPRRRGRPHRRRARRHHRRLAADRQPRLGPARPAAGLLHRRGAGCHDPERAVRQRDDHRRAGRIVRLHRRRLRAGLHRPVAGPAAEVPRGQRHRRRHPRQGLADRGRRQGQRGEDPEDLATATVAVNALKGVAEVQVRASLEKQGIDDSKMKLTEIPFPEMPVALSEGRVDAALVPEPFVTAVLQAGGHVVDTPYVVMGKHFPNGAWETSQQVIDRDPETVAAFTRAIIKSVEYARDNPDAVRKIIPEYTSVKPEMAAAIRLPIFSPDLPIDQMQELIGYTKSYGVLEKDLNAADLIYTPKS
ncbi:ABC transporter substrate-binding protein [Microbacterium elymi]|uniref:ABC transporter substrate-binding protein n=1 Tax=Microbacterium elymi TaxID=2909587 RepID=A0ABY5NME3_9MICO|nr:ABC transporter substrate-binding protein [Microbacterium elymi]UUT36365.1 ABC transporter substrate-binding protein [Microbacterium elymi]